MLQQLRPGELVKLHDELVSYVGNGVLDRAIKMCNIASENFAVGLADRLEQSLEYFNTRVRLAEFLGMIGAANPGAQPVVDDWLKCMEQLGTASSRRTGSTPRARSGPRPSSFLHFFDRQDVEAAAAVRLLEISTPPSIIFLVMVAREEDEPAFAKKLLSQTVADSSQEKSGYASFVHLDLPRSSDANADFSLRYAILKALDPGASPVGIARATKTFLAQLSQLSPNRLVAVDIATRDPDRDFRVKLLSEFLISLSHEPPVSAPKIPTVVLIALYRTSLACRGHEAQIETLKNAARHFRGATVIDLPALDDCEHTHAASWRDKLLSKGMERERLEMFADSFSRRLEDVFPNGKRFTMRSVKLNVEEIEAQHYD